MGRMVELTNGWIPLAAGPAVGSFLGVLIRRLPAGRPVAAARSACDACGAALGPAELIPLASYLALRGQCRHCGAPISAFHPAIEIAATLVPLSAWAAGGTGPLLWAGCVLGWTLLALAWIDVETWRLPDALTLPLVLAGLGEALWLEREAVADRALAAALAWLAFRAVSLTYRRLRGREGLGEGDAKLFAAGGAWLGTAALPAVLLGAALAGLGVAAVARLRGAAMDGGWRLPFGPCLSAAVWGVWLAQIT